MDDTTTQTEQPHLAAPSEADTDPGNGIPAVQPDDHDSGIDASTEVQRYDQMAKAASSGLMAHKDVESAIVEISGESTELVFHLTCTLVADTDPSAVMELVTYGVIANVERLLGETFASRDLQFAFAPSASAAR
jgi:hypothetical protein